jgi:hypothetical protein
MHIALLHFARCHSLGQNGPAGEAGPHAAAPLKPHPAAQRWCCMGNPLPFSLMPAADLLTLATRARRLAGVIDGDPGAARLIEMAEELEAEVARLSRL